MLQMFSEVPFVARQTSYLRSSSVHAFANKSGVTLITAAFTLPVTSGKLVAILNITSKKNSRRHTLPFLREASFWASQRCGW